MENKDSNIFTLRLKGYTRFVGECVTGRNKRFRTHKVYIFIIRITSRVDLAMSVCLSVRMNAEIWRTASLFRQCATPILTPTSRPKLWLHLVVDDLNKRFEKRAPKISAYVDDIGGY